jgi:glycosyltransferase involved in cell wall biosynthesis
MSELSVMLVTPQLTRDGGVATHVIATAELLARHDVKTSVLCARADPGERIPGVELIRSKELFNSELTAEQRLGEAIARAPQVVNTHQFDDAEVIAAIQANAPVLASAHGYTLCTSGVHYFRPGEECTRPHGPGCVPNLAFRGCAHTRQVRLLPAAYRRVSRSLQALRRADLAVSYSTAVDRHLAANDVTRRMTIPLFPTLPAAVGSGHADRRRVLFAGRIVAPKGVRVLIRAAREVDAEFVICGEGWRLEEMRRLAQREGVAARVTFTGWLGADELARELAEASIVVLPSVWPEPFGLVGIEAFAAGRPVVASATGGILDWLEDGVNGLAVEPGDSDSLARALNELLADPDRQQAMGAAGKAMARERYSPERHIAALLEAYGTAHRRWASRAGGSEAPPAPASARPAAV